MMGDKTKHLVRVGHEFAAAMSDDTPIITIAKMVTELASALDVQSARSEALAAENAALSAFGDKLDKMRNALNGEGTGIQGRAEVACQQVALEAAMEEFDAVKTPATDAWVNEQRAVAYNDLCAAFVMHRTTAGLDDSDKVTVKEATDALLHCAAQLRGSQV